jgi:hypothetical protein
MEAFASEGLRTLVIASAPLSRDFYNQWYTDTISLAAYIYIYIRTIFYDACISGYVLLNLYVLYLLSFALRCYVNENIEEMAFIVVFACVC